MTAAPPLTRVFVYGTLMPGEANAHVADVAAAPLHRTPATLHGYTLHHLHPEGYPALLPGSTADTVRGWLLTYAPEHWPAALAHLDALEGLNLTPPLYARVAVTVQTQAGQTPAGLQPAWVYVYARPERLRQKGCLPVPSGDWTQVQDRSNPS